MTIRHVSKPDGAIHCPIRSARDLPTSKKFRVHQWNRTRRIRYVGQYGIIFDYSGSGSAAGSIPSDLGSLKIAIFGNIEDPGSGAGSIPSDRSKWQYWTKSRIQRVRFLQIVLLQWTQLKSATSQGPPEGCLGPGTPPSPARLDCWK